MKHILVVFLFIGTLGYAQSNIPTDYFSDPLEIPLILSGSFGELRSNHFHSGLDIKTQQREGVPVYAPADGYVSRIKVGHYGYGKALYLKHPNGYSTVYAHLSKYNGAIQDYVKNKQYAAEKYEIELYPEASLLPVNKGEIIGFTGNSGSSGGPHLHYEIRDAASRPMNPMKFGVEIPDTKKPIINSVFAYPVGPNSHVNGSKERVKLRLIRQKDGSYRAENVAAIGKIGFGVSAHDQQNGASNKNGVYQIRATYNGIEAYNILFDRFSFDETRYLNRFIDYEYYKENRDRIQKLFREPNNPLSIIVNEENNGFVSMDEGFSAAYTIEVCDYQDNKVLISIPLKGEEPSAIQDEEPPTELEYVYHNQPTNISKGKFKVYIPSNSLYEDTYLKIESSGDTLHLHEDIVPIHKNITISMDISNYEAEDMSKLFLGRLNYKGVPLYNSTFHKGNTLSTRTRTFGSYTLASDSTPPTIKPHNFSDGKWISKKEVLQLKIEDDLSGISSYRATLNGNFILMEYDYKKDIITYDFEDAIVSDTENNLKVIVVDNVGNSATFEATFFRKQP